MGVPRYIACVPRCGLRNRHPPFSAAGTEHRRSETKPWTRPEQLIGERLRKSDLVAVTGVVETPLYPCEPATLRPQASPECSEYSEESIHPYKGGPLSWRFPYIPVISSRTSEWCYVAIEARFPVSISDLYWPARMPNPLAVRQTVAFLFNIVHTAQ